MNQQKGTRSVFFLYGLSLFVSFFALSSCALDKLAINMVGDALSSESSNTVFTGDDDPELIAAALPFAIKLYESLLNSAPDHPGLIRVTGSLYVMYANAFVAGPADYLGPEKYEDKEIAYARAKKFYLRAKDMLVDGLDKLYPGFKKEVLSLQPGPVFASIKERDVGTLYWLGAGWLSAFSLDPLNVELSVSLPIISAVLAKAYALNPDYGAGSLDEVYLQYYAALPDVLGGSKEKAAFHYTEALRKNGGKQSGTYLAQATSVYLPAQDLKGFRAELQKALSINPKADPDTTLSNILNQKKARWYLAHLDEFFFDLEAN